MVKLIVMDLDDTLLRTDKSISSYTKEILVECKQKGIKVVYATARGKNAEAYAPPELFDGFIRMNGAYAITGSEIFYKRLIDAAIARDLLIAFVAYGFQTAAEADGIQYANFPVYNLLPSISSKQVVDYKTLVQDVEMLYAVIKDHSDMAFIRNCLTSSLSINISRDCFAMITHSEATKAKAIAALAKCWGICPEDIVAFGDDLNDIEMLSESGTGVAMGNALPIVKEIANDVCETNDHDGVADWIATHILSTK